MQNNEIFDQTFQNCVLTKYRIIDFYNLFIINYPFVLQTIYCCSVVVQIISLVCYVQCNPV